MKYNKYHAYDAEGNDLTQAFYDGSETFKKGLGEINPFKNGSEVYRQWKRGYRNTRKTARFNATIKARDEKKS